MIKLKQLLCTHSFVFTREQIYLGNNKYQITQWFKCSKCGLDRDWEIYEVNTND